MADETVTENAQTETTEATTTPTAGGTNGGQPSGDARFTQADIDRIVKERLDREQATAQKRQQAAQAEAEKKRLAEDAKWQELAEKTQAELAALKAEAERAERLGAIMATMYENRIKALPANLRKAVESLPATDPLDRLAWLDANESLFTQVQAVPDINAGSGGPAKPPTTSLGGLTPQEFAARYNIDPRYITEGKTS